MQRPLSLFAPIIEMRHPNDLKPDPRNSKLHPDQQIKQVMRSIGEYGWTNPLLTDEDDGVIAGHARLEAAKRLGLCEVPQSGYLT